MTTAATMIPHSRPSIGPEEIRAATAVLQSGHLSQGTAVGQFERRLAHYLGAAGGVAVTSGTAALEVALRALEVGPGDEVILPSYVCAAPWLAVQRVGASARLVDIESETLLLDPAAVRRAATANTKAIIVPHLFGLPADLTELERLGIPMIEDCAHTLGAMEQGRGAGSVGRLTVCSFYATKLLCTGEGGMVLSRDRSLLERMRRLREYDGAPSLDPVSTNMKMTDLQAAMGLSQLEQLPSFLARRQALAQEFRAALAGAPVILPAVPAGRSHIYYRFVVRLPHRRAARLGLGETIARFEQEGVQCRKPVFRPLHRYLGLDGFPASDEAERTALSIPLFPALTDEEVVVILTALGRAWS
jgi:dTDP-4-amino-4,6-dideoxygalactose transaminase